MTTVCEAFVPIQEDEKYKQNHAPSALSPSHGDVKDEVCVSVAGVHLLMTNKKENISSLDNVNLTREASTAKLVEPAAVVVEANTKNDNDNGEDSSESLSSSTPDRRDSTSSADGYDEMDSGAAQVGGLDEEDPTTSISSPLTPIKKRSGKGRRRKSRPARASSVSSPSTPSLPSLNRPVRAASVSSPCSTPQPSLHIIYSPSSPASCSPDAASPSSPSADPTSSSSSSSTSPVAPSSSASNLDAAAPLDPLPTRGRSNAFYGNRAIPVLHPSTDNQPVLPSSSPPRPSASAASGYHGRHAGSSLPPPVLASTLAGGSSSASSSSSGVAVRRNTSVGASSSGGAVPDPSHSGISRPKLFSYWKGFTASPMEQFVISHSRRFLVGFAETIGRRPSMEDSMVIHGAFRGRTQEDYFALFDGHGGRDSAVFAAEHLHVVLAEKLKTLNPVKSLREAFAETHKMISEQKIAGGTTAVVALFIGKKGFIANVGDTRAVLCRDGIPHRVSLDHKPELPQETLRIRKLGGSVTTTYNSAGQATSRVQGMLAVSRALGDTNLHPYVSSDPEIHGPLNLDPQSRNQFVVLACDGVWDVISDQEATSIVAPIANPEEASRRLRDEAYHRGSTDNISVMVIRCPPFPPE